MGAVTLQAHFDGERILLNEPFELEPEMRLIVTVVPKPQANHDHRLAVLDAIDARSGQIEPRLDGMDHLRRARSGAMFGE